MNLTYKPSGDYQLPNLTLGKQPLLNKYGQMRLRNLKNQRRPLYLTMLASGRLMPHLQSIQTQAKEQVERTVANLAAKQGVTEELKACDQMAWTARMNSILHSAEEPVLTSLIFT